MASAKIPKLWRKSKIVALLKPGKSPSDPKSYRPISLLCHTFKLFERLILNRLTVTIDPTLIPEQAGFRPGKSCTSQVLNLTQFIEDGFERGMVTGAVFVDLSAAYDTVNIKKLLSKVSSATNDPTFVSLLSELLRNRRFCVHLHGKKSRWRCQKNGLPQGSVLAPILFNVYTNDQPHYPNTRRYIYADDLALTCQDKTFENVESTLNLALVNLHEYYEHNALRPNPSKTQSCAFHLRNREANRELNISWKDVTIQHCNFPRYLGVTLDRSLTYKTHCRNTKQKVSSRNNLLRRLSSTNWGANPTVMRTTGLALCFSAGEYACPVWARSAHTREVDAELNDTCRIVTGCLKPTPVGMLFPLAGIAPPRVRREVTCSLEKQKQESDPRHPLYGLSPAAGRLRSRKSFLRSAQPTDENPTDVRCRLWASEYPQSLYPPKENLPPGYKEPWPTWRSLNRLRTQVGRSKDNLCRWGYSSIADASCECGEPLQTMVHLTNCPACPTTCSREDLLASNQRATTVAAFWASKI